MLISMSPPCVNKLCVVAAIVPRGVGLCYLDGRSRGEDTCSFSLVVVLVPGTSTRGVLLRDTAEVDFEVDYRFGLKLRGYQVPSLA